MKRRAGSHGRAAARARTSEAPRAAPGLPLSDPGLLLALAVAAACVVVSASYRLYDTDLWSLLAVGRAIVHDGLPRRDLWTWTSFGEPAFVSSWAFRGLIAWLWDLGGVGAMFAWRWITTLGVFALCYSTARRLGARGYSAVLLMTAAALLYRIRTDVRPETLAALFLALTLWLLERDRASVAPTRALFALPAIACAWANVHISWYLGALLLGLHLLDAWRRGDRARASRLAFTGGLAAIALLLNPYGIEAVTRPFQFAFVWRGDPMFAAIAELRPLSFREALRLGLWAWPLLLLTRARRGVDLVEAGACAAFTALAFSSHRMIAASVVVAAPFAARDLHELIASRSWPIPSPPRAARGAATALAAVAMCLPAWANPLLPLGIGIQPRTVPERACDFMAAHAFSGHGFDHFHLGGYLAWRFWGDRGRLPFMSTQPELATAEQRRLYVEAFQSPEGWRAIQDRYRFDWALLDREQVGDDRLLDLLDRDSSWTMVFSDDAAELLVRRDGAVGALADSFAYRLIPAGRQGRSQLGALCERYPALRAAAERELDRMIAESPSNGAASHLRGTFALMDGDRAAARRHLERALALDPLLPGVHEMLGALALEDGRPRDALRELNQERRLHEPPLGSFYRSGLAFQALGQSGRAWAAYRRELALHPQHSAARDSIAALEARRRR
jgi:hypothetical protein